MRLDRILIRMIVLGTAASFVLPVSAADPLDSVEAELDSIVAEARVIENTVPDGKGSERRPASAGGDSAGGAYGAMIVIPLHPEPRDGENNRP